MVKPILNSADPGGYSPTPLPQGQYKQPALQQWQGDSWTRATAWDHGTYVQPVTQLEAVPWLWSAPYRDLAVSAAQAAALWAVDEEQEKGEAVLRPGEGMGEALPAW
jgi:hypothetical protein